jgi:hypothetical protein
LKREKERSRRKNPTKVPTLAERGISTGRWECELILMKGQTKRRERNRKKRKMLWGRSVSCVFIIFFVLIHLKKAPKTQTEGKTRESARKVHGR